MSSRVCTASENDGPNQVWPPKILILYPNPKQREWGLIHLQWFKYTVMRKQAGVIRLLSVSMGKVCSI